MRLIALRPIAEEIDGAIKKACRGFKPTNKLLGIKRRRRRAITQTFNLEFRDRLLRPIAEGLPNQERLAPRLHGQPISGMLFCTHCNLKGTIRFD